MKLSTVAAVEIVETEKTNARVVAAKGGGQVSENFETLIADPNMLILVVEVGDEFVKTPKRGKGIGLITWLCLSVKSRLVTGVKNVKGEDEFLAANGKALEFKVEVNLVD